MSSTETPLQGGKEAQRAVADWFLEVSALLAVFPWLDQLVFHPKGTFDWPLFLMATCAAFGLGFGGLSLLFESRRRRLLARIAGAVLFGLAAVIFLGT